ncbi:MAG TPA: twin-arginine translocation signal domain-containing protein [Thermoanaerobaculia bacterium]|nr:twin-arginine translocation signal domain-containing protein [Thermoanaerobaculia bacterium]
MTAKEGDSRRSFLRLSTGAGALLFAGPLGLAEEKRGKPKEDALGEAFEKEEHRLFGSDGFEKVVAEVAGLESRLGIADLATFTPAAGGPT